MGARMVLGESYSTYIYTNYFSKILESKEVEKAFGDVTPTQERQDIIKKELARNETVSAMINIIFGVAMNVYYYKVAKRFSAMLNA